MAENLIGEIATTIGSASINQNPDPKYDANPSTSFSKQSPVQLRPHALHNRRSSSQLDAASSDEIPLSVLEQPARIQNLPPLPDLRFEQSYLNRIKPFSHPPDGGPPQYLRIAWITFLDHVLFPLTQGLGWTLVLHGWRAWNTATKFQGAGLGAKIRRWWWNTNNWKLPPRGSSPHIDLGDKKLANQVGEFYEAQMGSAAMD